MYIFFGITILLFLLRLWMDQSFIKMTSYRITSPTIPFPWNGLKIIQLSDLHGRNCWRQICKKVSAQNPDLIVMTGDMVSANQTHFEPFYTLVEQLVAHYPVYYIKGNHEGRMPASLVQQIEETLRSYGVKLLENTKVSLQKDGKKIDLYGLELTQDFYVQPHQSTFSSMTPSIITKQLGEKEKNTYTILLSHTPKFFNAYATWGANLILTGHIHGGMIRLPFLGGVFSPYREWFPKYDDGKYEIKNATMIVNTGLSGGATGFRLFNRPEIVVITLHHSHAKNKHS